MVINKKGQMVMFYGLMLAVTIIVLALALAGPVKESVDNARNVTDYSLTNGTAGLNCDDSSISIFDKGACLVADISIFQFIGGIIFIAGAIISARIIFGQ